MKNKFENIWKEFHNRISAFVNRRIYDKELSEDCVQDVFIKINNGLTTLRDESKFESWIFQIARNTIADFNRAKIKNSTVPIDDYDKEIEHEENINSEVAEWIIPFIKQLPPKYSNPLMLYEIKGLSQQEIAEKENISLSGAKSRIQRGRVKLKDAINECCKLEIDNHGNILDYTKRENNCKKC
jgi:RNA polymerase sigma-70 factor, ECF subfamily